jgi:hypothetical protein
MVPQWILHLEATKEEGKCTDISKFGRKCQYKSNHNLSRVQYKTTNVCIAKHIKIQQLERMFR